MAAAPNTELAIDATETAPDGGTIVLMTQLVGRTWNVVTKLITGGSRYEIRTPTTTASVRGTKFEVDADADTTTVTTSEGLVVQRVGASGGRVVDVPVRAGMTQTQRRGVPPAPARPRSANAPDRGTAGMTHRTAHARSAAGRVVRGHYADASALGARERADDDATPVAVPASGPASRGASGASHARSGSDAAPPELSRSPDRRRG